MVSHAVTAHDYGLFHLLVEPAPEDFSACPEMGAWTTSDEGNTGLRIVLVNPSSSPRTHHGTALFHGMVDLRCPKELVCDAFVTLLPSS